VGHEAAAAKLALKEVLEGNSTLSSLITAVHFQSAPQNAVLPYIVSRMRSPGRDSQVIAGVRAMTSPLVDVGVWVEWDPCSDAAQATTKEIDDSMESLRSYQVTDANGDIWEVSSMRESILLHEEVDTKSGSAKKFYWVGGSYRLSISAV
jgi:hypothetical protein